MRIGVMTFWWSEDNYGQLLQCYALQKYLRDLGHDAFLIRYRMLETGPLGLKRKLIKYGLHPWKIFDGFRRVASRRKGRLEMLAHSRHFDDFRNRHLKMSDKVYFSLKEMQDDPPNADMYVVGSDQVWRFDETFRDEDIRAMMLDFGSPVVKRISYAASFGRNESSPRELRIVPPLLCRFDAISVREQTGTGLCRILGRNDARVVCDPTILLRSSDFKDIAELPSGDRKYVFCYMLTNDCSFKYQRLKQWADNKGLDIIYVTGNSLGKSSYGDEDAVRSYLTIPQWLGYLSRAEFVLTNSFHCCVFATHFGRKLGVVELRGEVKGMNSRIATLESLRTSLVAKTDGQDFLALDWAVESSFKPGVDNAGREYLLSSITEHVR